MAATLAAIYGEERKTLPWAAKVLCAKIGEERPILSVSFGDGGHIDIRFGERSSELGKKERTYHFERSERERAQSV